jgi:ankyrin repeat protein
MLSPLLCLMLAAPALSSDEVARLAGAVARQDRAEIAGLLEQGADANAAEVDGMTALHWAAHHADLDTAKQLIQAKANVHASNRYGVRPLSLACGNDSPELVELLLGAGADPNTTLPGGETALMTAARTGVLGSVRTLLARGAEVNAKERNGQTAVMWAAAEGHADVVYALIQAGADFRTPLPSGFTPLFFAAREGRREVVRVLLKAGVEVNEPMRPNKSGGKTPRQGTSPFIIAVENGHFELAAALLMAGADPNDQRSGFAALHVITWVRKPNRGDDPDGDPPPAGSGNMTSLEFVRELIRRGADVNLRLERGSSGRGRLNRTGATAFFMAADTADLPLMRLLVELGADPMIPNADRATPLMAAAGLGTMAPDEEAGTEAEMIEAVKYLLELGADVNAVDDNGETAVHGAAYNNAPKVVDLLVSLGAKIDVWNRSNKYGWTPLVIATGYRPGNFKPSPDTIAAIKRAMLAAGVTPPATVKPAPGFGEEYRPPKKTKAPPPSR